MCAKVMKRVFLETIVRRRRQYTGHGEVTPVNHVEVPVPSHDEIGDELGVSKTIRQLALMGSHSNCLKLEVIDWWRCMQHMAIGKHAH